MEIQPADSALRRRITWILSVVAIALFAAFTAFNIWLHRASVQLDTESLITLVVNMLRATCLGFAIAVLMLGVYLIMRGRRILADRRYPARDTRVVRDTPVRVDVAAVRIGDWCVRAGLLTCALGVFIPSAAWIYLGRFG